MTQESQKFIDLLKEDEALAYELKTVIELFEDDDVDTQFLEAVYPMAEEVGCEITLEDYKEYLKLNQGKLAL